MINVARRLNASADLSNGPNGRIFYTPYRSFPEWIKGKRFETALPFACPTRAPPVANSSKSTPVQGGIIVEGREISSRSNVRCSRKFSTTVIRAVFEVKSTVV